LRAFMTMAAQPFFPDEKVGAEAVTPTIDPES
jgi:hypothetical protein